MPSALSNYVSRYVPPILKSSRIHDELAEVPTNPNSCRPATAPSWMFAHKTESGQRLPLVFAHRGWKAKFPENTMAAFRGAVAAGAYGLETDIHLTRDGVVVLSHDATLERCFGRKEKIIDVDWEFLETQRTVQEPREPMPRLTDLLKYLAEDGAEDVKLLLDIKMDNDSEDVVRKIAEAIASIPPHPKRPWETRVVMGVWAYKYLPICEKHVPDHPIAHIGFSTTYAQRFFSYPKAVAYNMLVQSLYLQPSFIRKVHDRPVPVMAWTVNDEEWMRWCIQQGVDVVITDDPTRFLEIKTEWQQGNQQVRIRSKVWGRLIYLWLLMYFFSTIIRWKSWKKGYRLDGQPRS